MSALGHKNAELPFRKMHGLGNDFVIIDARGRDFVPSVSLLRSLSERRRGVGCDQVIILREPRSPFADIYMDIFNGDGSHVGACGNATRCVAQLMFLELGRDQGTIETVSGRLPVWQDAPHMIGVDFGEPRLEWQDIPLARHADTLHAPVVTGALVDPCCVNMGNPHAVFFVPDVQKIVLAEVGPRLECDPLFPERCNIEIAQILSSTHIRMRVWERGAGITEACGSGACATLVAAVRRGLSNRRAAITLDGGDLTVEWQNDNHVLMIGPAALSFTGIFTDTTPLE